MSDDWFDNLKIGDKVIRNGYWGKSVEIVIKITPTGQIVLGNGDRFKMPSRRMGDGKWEFTSLEQWSPDSEREIKDRKRYSALQRKINGVQWGRLSLEQLEEVWEIVKVCENER